MDAKETVRYWLVGHKSMSSMPIGGRGQKSRGFSNAQNGTKSDERIQKFSGSWSTKQEPQRRSGSGKEVSWRTLSVKANGTGVISA